MALKLTFAPGGLLLAGSGRVGTGVARLMARGGVPVTFTYRHDAARAQALCAEITEAGGLAQAVMMDATDRRSVDAALDSAAQFGGGVAHVVNAGGPMMPFGRMADLNEQALERFLVDDAMGNLRVAQAAIPYLRQRGGSITFCTTIANFRVVAYDGASPFAKGGVEALMRQIASEEADAGVRANSVAISWVSDRTREEQLADLAGLPPAQLALIEELIGQLGDETPLRRPASSEEAAWVFAFLASQQAAYITGQTLRLDGGFGLGGLVSPKSTPGEN